VQKNPVNGGPAAGRSENGRISTRVIRPCFLIIDKQYPGSISTRKLVIETAMLNVLTAYSAQEAVETLYRYPGVDGVVQRADRAAARDSQRAAGDYGVAQRARSVRSRGSSRVFLRSAGSAGSAAGAVPERNAKKGAGSGLFARVKRAARQNLNISNRAARSVGRLALMGVQARACAERFSLQTATAGRRLPAPPAN